MRESIFEPQTATIAPQPVSAPWRPTAGTVFGVVANEFRKGLLNFWAHRTPILAGVAVTGGFYLSLMIVVGRGRLPRDILPLTVLGMAAYIVAWLGSLHMVADQLEEMRAGTLEQAHLSPVPSWMLVLGRLASAALQGLVVAAGLVAGVLLLADVGIPMRWELLVPGVLTLMSAMAFALLFSGIVLTNPFVGEVHHVAEGVIGVFNGAYLPVALFPEWLRPMARLLPTTLGVEAMQDIVSGRSSLGDLWSGGLLAWLAVHTVALTALAILVFVRNYGKAVRDGGLGRY